MAGAFIDATALFSLAYCRSCAAKEHYNCCMSAADEEILARWLLLRANVILVLLAISASLQASTLADPIWVRFDAARAEPSELALRALKGQHGLRRSRDTESLRGLLTAPVGQGPFPAVVLLHDCRGIQDNQRNLAQWLAEQGFITLVVDSFFSRNAINVCDEPPNAAARQAIGGRVFDAFGALEYLSRDPRVDGQRVAVVDWGDGHAISAISRSGPGRLVRQQFRAAVAISPQCALIGDHLRVPLLLVVAERDQYSRMARCTRFAESYSRSVNGRVELALLPNARYGFDDPSAMAGQLVAGAFDRWHTPRRGLSLHYDRDAHEQSIARITAFLLRELASSQPHEWLFDTHSAATWVIDPTSPGPNRASIGRSLFDHLLAYWRDQGLASPPFPLSALTARLAEIAGRDDAGRSGVKIALIPLGRSLQRHAAAPDFFEFPRVVIGLDGETDAQTVASLPRLKDRLFIGYQERSGVLEVISFNEQADRFEFQIVENYREGAVPQVRLANRALCVSCHHHHGPIFPRAGWDETNQNTSVAARVHRARPDLYGIQSFLLNESAALIDNATDRASEHLLARMLWRRACGASSPHRSKCHRAMLLAALQYRLSGSNGFDRGAPEFKAHVMTALRDAFATRWRHGLKLPSADLPNREPLNDASPSELSALQDPLTPRPPQYFDATSVNALATRWVHGIAQALPASFVVELDQQLTRQRTARTSYLLNCELTERGHASEAKLYQAQCAQPGRIQLELRFEGDNVQLKSGQVTTLRLIGQPAQQRLWVLPTRVFTGDDGGHRIELEIRQRDRTLNVRRIDGGRLSTARLRWPRMDDASRRTPIARYFAATLELSFAEESFALTRAVDRAVANGDRRGGGSTPMATHLLARVIETLNGGHSLEVCCSQDPPFAQSSSVDDPSSIASRSLRAPDLKQPVQQFRRACAQCHGAATSMPPGFLHGDDATAYNALLGCAERIFLRLSMWQLPAGERPRSPMPPASAMPATSGNATIATLRDIAAAWLNERFGTPPNLAQMLEQGYSAAPPCTLDHTKLR